MEMKGRVAVLAAFLGAMSVANAGIGTLARTNAAFAVEWDTRNGGLKSLVLNADTNRMNWIEGTGTWGTIRSHSVKLDPSTWEDSYFNPPLLEFKGLSVEGDEVVSRYQDGTVEVVVRRRLEADALVESYAFTNRGYAPRYYARGHLGILATFNDSYHAAEICNTRRCHAHVHARGEKAFVHALRMSPFDTEIVLSMTEGALDGYSVRRIMKEYSNDRGDFVLHAAPFELLQGETRRFSWRIAAVKAGTFVPPVRVRYETCFPGEEFEIADAEGTHRVKAERSGPTEAFGARLFVSTPFDELVEKCIRHIVRKQQCKDPKSPLCGAFLIYDDETGRQYFDDRFGDHNASRERAFMGMLLARWLRTHDDPEVRAALDLYERFVFREFVDAETGVVYNTIGKNPNQKRLYNGPFAAELLLELYELKGGRHYLETIKRIFLDFYANGGKNFYPNGGDISRAISLMEKAGLDVAKLKQDHREHIDRVLANGIDYPAHEVRFEQTIVTPAVRLLAGYWLYLEKDPKVLEGLRQQIAMLERFDGDQPDYLGGGVPIRHWDGYWFGKTHLYGDTVHYLSALSGNAYMLYHRVTDDEKWREKAGKCFRNLLSLYRPDGFGSAAYFIPYSVTMLKPDGKEMGPAVRGEKYDAFANDQYGALYVMLKNREAFRTSTASGDPFIEQLIAKMTLEEKVGQCVQLSTLGAKGATDFESNAADGNSVPKDAAAWVRNGEVGSLIGCCGVGKFNAFQKIAREESRLGIPLMVGHDMIHGVKTQFPIGPALACLWDEAAWEACGRLIALETPLKGCNWTFAPMLDIARDPRWGRIAEGPGQDPLIGARMGAALVRGIQSKDVDFPVAACVKHYVGYGAAFAGRDYFAVEMSESTLRNVYLPPFKAAVAAGALTVMPAFHTFNGVPCSVNRWLLTDILRKELGFSGFCISDWNAVDECQRPGCHGLAENNNVDASALAVHAGMDMDMMSGAYQKGLVQAVKSGKLPLAELDEAVRRILSVKKALNLWEKPYIDERAVAARVDLKAHAALARDVGARCCVLLKNENRTLPLWKGAKVLLVGPGATDVRSLSGAWTSFVENPSCMLLTEGLKDCGVDFTSVPGYDFKKPGVDTAAIDAAAAKADAIVAIFGESGRASGEGQSYLRMELPPVQLEALRHLKTLKKPLVALLSGGRPRAIPELAAEADAILDVWSLGTSAGGAMADVLTGKVNPEGRLTVEIPYATGQLPLFYNRTASGRPAVEIGQTCASCYKDGPFQALYPFGYGLSYTTFAYANEKVSMRGDKVVFEADVTNTGDVEGVETVQAYTRDLVGVESRPVRELRGWRRLKLKPGETRHAEIAVPIADLGYWAGSRFVPADGEHWAWVAHDSVSGKKCAFTLSGMR